MGSADSYVEGGIHIIVKCYPPHRISLRIYILHFLYIVDSIGIQLSNLER